MDDLVRWLNAQLDTDERIACEAPTAIGSTGRSDGAWADPQARWVADHHLVMRRPLTGDEEVRIVADCATFGGPPAAVHIAEWDPARVLREVDSKRQVLALHAITVEKANVPPFDSYTGERNPDEYNVTCAVCGWASDDRSSACLTLRLLALPFADREGYRPEWAPTE